MGGPPMRPRSRPHPKLRRRDNVTHDPTSFEIDRTQRRLGPIWLSPSITPVNVLTLFYSAMMTIVFITSLGLLHPYLLHAHLEMPTGIQGDFTGNLSVVIELVAIALVAPVGVFSDRLGRRRIFVAGFLAIALGLTLIPLARTPIVLIMLRMISSAGIAACTIMLASCIADYAQNASRGKLISVNGVITGFGVVVISSFIFARLPKFYAELGAAPIEAGTLTFWTMAAIAVLTALITWLGVKDGDPRKGKKRQPPLELLRTGIGEVRKNPKLGLSCAAAFVSRGDLTVLATFFALWIMAVNTDQGIMPDSAQSEAGRLFGISQFAMLIFTPVIGFIVDRLDRVTALIIAFAVATVGYLALGIVGDPLTSPLIYLVAIMAGAGEACIIVAGPALVGQEAPAPARGSIIGVVGFFGAVGVLINLKLSGIIFDAWMYQGPFILMAGMNLAVMIYAIVVRLKYGARLSTDI